MALTLDDISPEIKANLHYYQALCYKARRDYLNAAFACRSAEKYAPVDFIHRDELKALKDEMDNQMEQQKDCVIQ